MSSVVFPANCVHQGTHRTPESDWMQTIRAPVPPIEVVDEDKEKEKKEKKKRIDSGKL